MDKLFLFRMGTSQVLLLLKEKIIMVSSNATGFTFISVKDLWRLKPETMKDTLNKYNEMQKIIETKKPEEITEYIITEMKTIGFELKNRYEV
jgi:hypothetical protein